MHHMSDSGPDVRAMVRAAVEGRTPVDARERTSVAELLDAFDRLEHPFSERSNRVHVTASAVVVSDLGVLLHLHKRLGLWLQPGGHIDAGELPWQAALRETFEETGLRGTLRGAAGPTGEAGVAVPPLLHVDVHSGGRGHRHLDLRYLVDAPPDRPSPPAGESQQVRWFPWHRAISMADAGLEGVLRAVQPGVPAVRPVRGNDAGECAAVYLRSRRYALDTVPVVHADGEVRRWMADDVIGRTDTWVADLDGTVVGLLVLDGGWIEQLYLDPAWMGRGLGDRFVEIAKERNPGGLQVWTFQVNEPALRFFLRHGFVEVERTAGAGNEERAPDVRLRWAP